MRIAPLFLACTLLSGCGFPPPLSSEDREALASCNADVNRTWNVQHRADLSLRPEPDAPYSGNTPPGLPSDGLSDQYAHNAMIEDCLHGNSAEPLSGPVANPAPEAPPAHP
jgi:hypothetical protein